MSWGWDDYGEGIRGIMEMPWKMRRDMCNEITRRRYVNNTSGSRGALGNCGLTKTSSKTKLPAQKIIAVKSEKLLWLRNRLHLLPFASSLFRTQWKFRGNTHVQGLIFPFARQSSGSHCKKTKKKKKTFISCFREVFLWQSRIGERSLCESGCGGS